MSDLINLDLLTPRAGSYRTGTANALRDGNLLPLARLLRRQLSQQMVPLDRDSAGRRIREGRYLISRKVDGEFTMLVFRGGEVLTLNPYGTVRHGADFHAEAASLLSKAGIKDAILTGELYVRWPDGRRSRVHDVTRLARSPQSVEDVGLLSFAAFGIERIDGEEFGGKPFEAYERLEALLKGGQRVHAVETVTGDAAKVMERFAHWVDERGEEGVVAQSLEHGWFKIKPRHSLDLAVIGYSEGTGERAGMLHSLLLAVVRGDGSYHVVGRTGGGFSDDERVRLLAELKTKTVASNYWEVNSDRVAYAMTGPGLVAEIHCLDVITTGSDGSAIERMVLTFDEKNATWDSVRRLPLASIISPQFVRLREDKTASAEDCGVAQLSQIAEVGDSTGPVGDIVLPKATVLRRAVATKEIKGRTMVRKLLMWQTNKDAVSEDHPAYVLLSTDYSPNRKTPLERDIRVSSSREQIEAYWAQFEEASFVKGWVVQAQA